MLGTISLATRRRILSATGIGLHALVRREKLASEKARQPFDIEMAHVVAQARNALHEEVHVPSDRDKLLGVDTLQPAHLGQQHPAAARLDCATFERAAVFFGECRLLLADQLLEMLKRHVG